MTDSSQFADFSTKAKGNLEQIKTCLLRHDRNPQDREFLNDISKSLRSIIKDATPLQTKNTLQLCESLDSLITLIREEKKELHQEIIILFAMSRDRLSKLAFELDTVQKERTNVKDLIRKIEEQVERYNEPEETEVEEKPSKESRPSPTISDEELLPEEIVNKEYDEELFQIYIEQLQENISLLRYLTDRLADEENRSTVIDQCSDLVGKLQSSANYMGYDRLAEFYLQWVAELEMTGVDLSMGSSVTFDFMDEKIKKIAGLFPEVKDTPAEPTAIQKIQQRTSDAEESEEEEKVTQEKTVTIAALDGVDDEEEADRENEPIAALAGESPPEKPTETSSKEKEDKLPVKRKLSPKKVVELDASFLVEEMQSEDFDEELFQIFSQQLQENLSQLRELTESYTQASNKSDVIVQCSNLVGKLQSSANYMGYERLAEYYLQWIAELEMAGVELSIGTEIAFDFMTEKIDKITRLFLEREESAEELEQEPEKEITPPTPEPEAEKITAPPETEEEEPPQEVETKEDDTFSLDESDLGDSSFDFSDVDSGKLGSLFSGIEEDQDEEEDFEGSFEAIAGIRADIEEEEEPLIPVEEYDDIHYDDEEEEEEELSEGIEPIAGLSDEGFLETIEDEEHRPLEERLKEEAVADTGEKSFGEEFSDALDDKLEDFFKEVGEPEEAENLEESFMEIASMSDDFDESADMESVAAVTEFADQAADGTDKEARDAAEEIHDEVSALFGEPPEGDEEVSEDETAEPDKVTHEDAEQETVASDVGEFFAEPGDAAVKVPAGTADEVSEDIDESMDSFFAEIGETEETETTEEPEEEEKEAAADIEPVAGEVADLFAEGEELPEEEPEEVAGEFAEEVEETMESFFSDIGEPEEAEAVEAPADEIDSISEEAETEAEPVAAEVEDLFAESEELPEKEPEEIAGEFAEEVEDQMDSFFADIGEQKETEKADEPTEAFAEPAEENLEDEEAVAGELSEDEPFAEEISEEPEPSEEVLTDEELLREIEGPTVGEEISAGTEPLISDIDAAEEAVSAISEEELSEQELFEKLEGAISHEEEQPEEAEDLDTEVDDIYAVAGETEEILDTSPERKELYEKLTDALHELDEETEFAEEYEEEELAETQEVIDSGLYDKLSTALEIPEGKESAIQKSFDHVLEEILTGSSNEPQEELPFVEQVPKKLTAEEIKQIIQMDSGKVDALLDRFGELSANRSSLAHLIVEMKELHQHYQELEGLSKQELKPLKDLIFRLGDANISLQRVSNDLREGIIQVRMIPISLLFDRYHDFIANLAAKSNKKIELEIVGEDTELEKIVLDEISEPLTNLISNAIEHGIETIDERKTLGKKETGNIKLVAYQEDNQIVIEIMDNGRGIDFSKVKTRAMQLELFSGDELYNFSESDLKNIIMAPGFSFDDSRGEGLHIVKSNIENINGSIDIRSSAGKGTIFQIRLPFSLLVVKALKVNVGKEIMALPVTGIEEIIRINRNKVIEKNGNQFVEFNGTTIPLYRMSEIFDIDSEKSTEEKLNIIIVASRQRSIALIVDSTDGLEEIVIKPLGETLRKKSGFAGATIISDGKISLVPDIDEVISSAAKQQTAAEETAA